MGSSGSSTGGGAGALAIALVFAGGAFEGADLAAAALVAAALVGAGLAGRAETLAGGSPSSESCRSAFAGPGRFPFAAAVFFAAMVL